MVSGCLLTGKLSLEMLQAGYSKKAQKESLFEIFLDDVENRMKCACKSLCMTVKGQRKRGLENRMEEHIRNSASELKHL